MANFKVGDRVRPISKKRFMKEWEKMYFDKSFAEKGLEKYEKFSNSFSNKEVDIIYLKPNNKEVFILKNIMGIFSCCLFEKVEKQLELDFE